jgi:hypothetical protein
MDFFGMKKLETTATIQVYHIILIYILYIYISCQNPSLNNSLMFDPRAPSAYMRYIQIGHKIHQPVSTADALGQLGCLFQEDVIARGATRTRGLSDNLRLHEDARQQIKKTRDTLELDPVEMAAVHK